jgi:hypothetical protein
MFVIVGTIQIRVEGNKSNVMAIVLSLMSQQDAFNNNHKLNYQNFFSAKEIGPQ